MPDSLKSVIAICLLIGFTAGISACANTKDSSSKRSSSKRDYDSDRHREGSGYYR